MERSGEAKRQQIADPGSAGTVKLFPLDFTTLTITTAGTRTLQDPTQLALRNSILICSTVAAAVVSASSISYTLNAGDFVELVVALNASGVQVWAVTAGSVYPNSVQSQVVATQALTVAQVTAGLLNVTGSGASSFSMPTAAAMIAAFANPSVGQTWWLTINNNSDNTITLTAGGATLEGGAATIATTLARMVCFQITAVGTPAYTACLVI